MDPSETITVCACVGFISIVLFNKFHCPSQTSATKLHEVETTVVRIEPEIALNAAITMRKRYPWEPKEKVNQNNHQNNHSSYINKAKVPSHISTSQDDAKNQLQFLSSMTFANGGLREPSCPCCG
jgi:hypothetical protein